jgi:small conductance mechanosensitive channel
LFAAVWLAAPSAGWCAAAPATTTGDVSIPVEQLKVQVKPLTRSELEPEVEAWYALVRAKAMAISASQRSVKSTNEAIEHAEADTEAATAALDEAAAAQQQAERAVDAHVERPSGPPGPGETLEDRATVQKEAALEDLTVLQEEQTGLVDRFRVVLDSFAAKGGEVEEYEKYIAALQTIEVDPSGWEETLAVARGWLASEEGGVRLVKRIAVFLAILLASWLLARLTAGVSRRWLARSEGVPELAKGLIRSGARNLVLFVGFLMAVASLGVPMGPMLAALGAGGFIVGFALQGTLSNFASGLMILIYGPYDVGDVVEAGGVAGKVVAMNLVSTTFHTADNQRIIVPNSEIWGSVITNVTANDTRRVDLSFGVGHKADLRRVEEVLRETLAEHPLVLAEPAPAVQLQEIRESGVVFICRPWARTDDYWNVHWGLTRAVKERFDAEAIPFSGR